MIFKCTKAQHRRAKREREENPTIIFALLVTSYGLFAEPFYCHWVSYSSYHRSWIDF